MASSVMLGPGSAASVRRPQYAYQEHSVRADIDNRESVLRYVGLGSGQQNQSLYEENVLKEELQGAGA